NTAELFDPAVGAFSSLTPDVMTASRRGHAATLLPNGSVLITGGDTNGQPIKAAELFNCPPVLSHVADTAAEAGGADGANVNFSPPVATDLAGAELPVTCTPSPGAMFPFGTTIVTCSATDSLGA